MEITKLIDYDEWANRKVYHAIQEIKEGEEKKEADKLFAHVLSAQIIWLSRITGKPAEVEIWPEISIDGVEKFLKENPQELKDQAGNSSKIIEYSNSKGQVFQNSVEEILMHLVIHGQHHRAQIAKLLRKAGKKPPATDFIFFLRTVHN